jgi:K+-sensing histidine kinase KdpD
VEHADTSPIRIDITIRPVDDGYELAVSDNGPGLPEHERRVITDGEETELRHSSGMGLWLVNWIIPEFGGTIQLGSGGDGGTKITIWLPQPGREASTELDHSHETSPSDGRPVSPSTGTTASRFPSVLSLSDFLRFNRK